MERKYHSNLSFNDLLFNVLLGFVVLFIVAFLLINPPTKKEDVPFKAEFLIIVEWPEETYHDVDTWVRDPAMRLAGFQNKETGILHLDRDDLGGSNDRVKINGKEVLIKLNREVVTIRGIVPGDYYVSIHLYRKSSLPEENDGPVPVTVTFMDVNPYQEIYIIQDKLNAQGDELILPGVTVDEKGNVSAVFKHNEPIVPVKRFFGSN